RRSGRDAPDRQVGAGAARPQRPVLVRFGQEVPALPRRLGAEARRSRAVSSASPAVSAPDSSRSARPSLVARAVLAVSEQFASLTAGNPSVRPGFAPAP